jgi:hypothetical protein
MLKSVKDYLGLKVSGVYRTHVNVEKCMWDEWVGPLRLGVRNTTGIYVYNNQTSQQWRNIAQNGAIRSSSKITRY